MRFYGMRTIGETLRASLSTLMAELNVIVRWPQVRSILAFCLFEAAFYFAYQYGMSFSPATASPFWFPDSVLLCALLLTRPKRWWVFVLAPLPIRLGAAASHGMPLWFLLGTFALDSAKGVLAATTVRRFNCNPLRFDNVRDFAFYCLFAVLLVPAAGAFGGAAMLHVFGNVYWSTWWRWFLGNALTQLVVTPAIFYWIFQGTKIIRSFSAKRWIEAGLLTAGLIVTGIFAFDVDPDLSGFTGSHSYLCIPFLAWATIRFGMFGASGAVAVIACVSVHAVLSGQGPFAGKSPIDTAEILQEFLLVQAVPLYVVAILIEQRNGIERSLRESEQRFRTMADTAPVLIWMSGTHKLCEFFNQGWLNFTGRTLSQELGNGWADGVHPDDVQRCLRIYHSAFDLRQPFEMEYRLRRYDRKYRWVLDKGVPRYAPSGDFVGYIGTAIDIDDRWTQEIALRNSEQRYREVVESQTDLVCRYRPDTTLTFANEAFCHFLKKSREELIGTSLLQWIPTDKFVHTRVVSSIPPPTPVTFECEVASFDGDKRWQQWLVCPAFDSDGRVVEFQAIARDVTERRRAEDSLRATHRQLNDLAGQLIHAQEEERKRIARELHDDFNQQIAAHAIALFNLRIQLPRGAEFLQQQMTRLYNDAVRLGDQIRMIAHQLHSPTFKDVGLKPTLHSFCKEFSELTQLQVDLRVMGDTNVPADVASCCYHVTQEALQNIHKHARATSVQVRVQLMTQRVVLLVADNGTGVPAERSRTPRGMGIASMGERVKLLSGEFLISKRGNGGTLIAVDIPVA
jgi:PAS domain S-box-containing protein